MLAILMASLIAFSGLNVTSADVVYSPDNITVVFHYSLDPFQKINAFLFGCEDIDDAILGLLKNSSGFEIVKVSPIQTVLRFNMSDGDDYYYFSGVNLTMPISMRISINGSVLFHINSTKIPEMYIFK